MMIVIIAFCPLYIVATFVVLVTEAIVDLLQIYVIIYNTLSFYVIL